LLSCFGEVRQNRRGAARVPQNAQRSAAASRRSRDALAFGFAERKARAAPPWEFLPTCPESEEYALSQRLRRFAGVDEKRTALKPRRKPSYRKASNTRYAGGFPFSIFLLPVRARHARRFQRS